MTPLERAMRRAKIAAYDEIAEEVGHRNSHPIEVIEAVRRRGGQGETILKLKQDTYLLKARINDLEEELQKFRTKTTSSSPHPMQAIGYDSDGIIRFRENKIIRQIFDRGFVSLNHVDMWPVPPEDRMQLAQLLGYSVSGYGDLSYASRESVYAADTIAAALLATKEEATCAPIVSDADSAEDRGGSRPEKEK